MKNRHRHIITHREYTRDNKTGKPIARVEIDAEQIFYDDDGDLLSWALWSDTCNDFIPQNLETLYKVHPTKLAKLMDLALEENLKRIEELKSQAESRAVEAYMENEMERAGNE